MITTWDMRFLDLAKFYSQWSKDPSTQVGAVIVRGKNEQVSQGYNGPPSGVDDTLTELNRETKLAITLHAEKNALLKARQDVRGCTCYVWPMPPCSQCAAALIQAGISRVVSAKPTQGQISRWGNNFSLAQSMYDQAGVVLEVLE